MSMIPEIYCNFIPIDTDRYQCSKCETIIRTIDNYDYPPIFICKNSMKDNNQISFLEKVKNFAGAAIDHAAAGFPVCSDEQIKKRFSICQTCEFLTNNTCSKCGCPISRTKTFASKLAWADQECPIGKWKKEN